MASRLNFPDHPTSPGFFLLFISHFYISSVNCTSVSFFQAVPPSRPPPGPSPKPAGIIMKHKPDQVPQFTTPQSTGLSLTL